MTGATLRTLLPLVILGIVLAVLAAFAFFEAIYLGEQARQLGRASGRVAMWMWVFRLLTALLASGVLYCGYRALREAMR